MLPFGRIRLMRRTSAKLGTARATLVFRIALVLLLMALPGVSDAATLTARAGRERPARPRLATSAIRNRLPHVPVSVPARHVQAPVLSFGASALAFQCLAKPRTGVPGHPLSSRRWKPVSTAISVQQWVYVPTGHELKTDSLDSYWPHQQTYRKYFANPPPVLDSFLSND